MTKKHTWLILTLVITIFTAIFIFKKRSGPSLNSELSITSNNPTSAQSDSKKLDQLANNSQDTKIKWDWTNVKINTVKDTLDEVGIKIEHPDCYTIHKSEEENRSGSIASYDFHSSDNIKCPSCPYVQEILFFTKESMQAFDKACDQVDPNESSGEGFCDTRSYPTVTKSNEIQSSLKSDSNSAAKLLNNQKYIARQEGPGLGYTFLKYQTFVNGIYTEIWVDLCDNESPEIKEISDKLVSNFSFSK